MDIVQVQKLYELERPRYMRLTHKLRTLLADELLMNAGIPYVYISSRTKAVTSLVANFQRAKFSSLEGVHDASALRVVTLHKDSALRIEALIRQHFDVERIADPTDALGVNKFGYRSKHFIVKQPPARLALPEWSEFSELLAEIQVRTQLDDVWGQAGRELQHKLEANLPTSLRRRLHRLSAILEMADDELWDLRVEWQEFLQSEIDRMVREQGVAPNKEEQKRLSELAERLYHDQTYNVAEPHLRAEFARTHPDVYAYLEFHLRQHPVRIGAHRIDVMRRDLMGTELIVPVGAVKTNDVRLGKLAARPVRHISDWHKSDFIREGMSLGRLIQDNLVFAPERINVQPDYVEIDGNLTTYASSLVAHDQLETELLASVSRCFKAGNNEQRFADLSTRLPKRTDFERASGGDLSGPAMQYAGISTSTLLVVGRVDGEYGVLFQRRAAGTAVHGELFHVIPAAMFQPAITFPTPAADWELEPLEESAKEWDWKFNVVREYGEELFGEEVKPPVVRIDQIDARTPHTFALATELDNGGASLICSGLVINLLNMRPEICSVLIIKNAPWWAEQSKQLSPNWEYESAQPGRSKGGPQLREFRLSNVDAEFKQLCGSSAAMWVPPGLGALWLGVDIARRELNLNARGT